MTAKLEAGTATKAKTGRQGDTPSPAKQRLLHAVVEYFSREGVGDRSLRQIAAAIGSSHRMLLYHFGSREGLLVEVATAVEERTRAQFSDLAAGQAEATDDVVRRVWRLVADPALGDFERLFFALYGRGLQGDEGIRPLLGDNIEAWLDANAATAATSDVPADVARVHARLGLAVTRGLLLDLLATGDKKGVDAAMEVYAQRYVGRWWEDSA